MQALKGIRDKVQLATKFGIHYENGVRTFRGDPAYVRAACEASLKRLDVDYIDLYYQHRIDTSVPIEITVRIVSCLSRKHNLHSRLRGWNLSYAPDSRVHAMFLSWVHVFVCLHVCCYVEGCMYACIFTAQKCVQCAYIFKMDMFTWVQLFLCRQGSL